MMKGGGVMAFFETRPRRLVCHWVLENGPGSRLVARWMVEEDLEDSFDQIDELLRSSNTADA
jgi:hypothetical protein